VGACLKAAGDHRLERGFAPPIVDSEPEFLARPVLVPCHVHWRQLNSVT
jgi:hypothetical protein